MEEKVLTLKKKRRVAVAWAQDTNTLGALNKAVKKGLIDAVLVGEVSAIRNTCKSEGIDIVCSPLQNLLMRLPHPH